MSPITRRSGGREDGNSIVCGTDPALSAVMTLKVGAQNAGARHELDPLMARVRGEYREMPGMQLTIAQATRLWQLDRRACEAVLTRLVDEGFLMQTSSGVFVSVSHAE